MVECVYESRPFLFISLGEESLGSNPLSFSFPVPTDSESELYLPYLVTAVLGKPPKSTRSVVCQQCKRNYASRQSLRLHQRLECGKPKTFKCPYCDLTAYQKGNVVKHIRLKHLGAEIKVDRINMDQLALALTKKAPAASSSKARSQSNSPESKPILPRATPTPPLLPLVPIGSTAVNLVKSGATPPPPLIPVVATSSNSVSVTPRARPPPMLISILTPEQLPSTTTNKETAGEEAQDMSVKTETSATTGDNES